METSQAQLQHSHQLLQTNFDEAAYAPAPTLREITNHSNKHLHDQLERAGSGSLQRRDSNSAAVGPDAANSAGTVPVSHQEPPGFHELNIAEVIKGAAAETAEQNSGNHWQPNGQAQAPLPDSMPQHTNSSPPGISPASSLDAHDSAPRVPVPHKQAPAFIEVNNAELKQVAAAQAAEQDSGKRRQLHGQPQASLPDTVPQRTKPTPHQLSLPGQAGHHAHANTNVQDLARHSSRNDSADTLPIPHKKAPDCIAVSIAELRQKAAAQAADQDSGKHRQLHGQPQASLPDSMPQRTQPTPHKLSLPGLAGHHAHAKRADTNTTFQDLAKHSSRNDSADRLPVPHKKAPDFIVMNIAELRQKAAAQAAQQDSGKHRQLHGQPQASLPDSVPQRTQPTPHKLTLPGLAGHHAHAKRADINTNVQDLARHSFRTDSLPAGDHDTAAAAPAAAQSVGRYRRAANGSDQKAEQHNNSQDCYSKQPNSRSVAHLHRNGDAKPDAGAAAAALVRPQGSHPCEVNRAFQPPLSADPDNIAAWDTPRLEQLPVKLPEPWSTAHVGAAALDSADPACKAGSAYDSPRAAQARGSDGVVVEESADGTWPAHVMVVCNSNVGKFLLVKQTMVCTCKLCQNKAAKMGVPFVDMTPTEFERHSGT